MDKFENMVEDIELNEDIVECKECFDLFPKIDCVKQQVGYLCPACNRSLEKVREREIDSTDITTGLYGHDFPEVADYDATFDSKPVTGEDLDAAFDALIDDEYQAVAAYDEMANEVQKAEEVESDDKEEILDTLDHIKEEEKEHLDELGEIQDELEDEHENDDSADEAVDAVRTPLTESEELLEKSKKTIFTKKNKGSIRTRAEAGGRQLLTNIIGLFHRDQNKALSLFFVNGYSIVVRGITPELENDKEVKNVTSKVYKGKEGLVDAMNRAKKLSTVLAKHSDDAEVFVVANKVDLSKFGLGVKSVIDNGKKYANIIASFVDGSEDTNNIKDLASELVRLAQADEGLRAVLSGGTTFDEIEDDPSTDTEEPGNDSDDDTSDESDDTSDDDTSDDDTSDDEDIFDDFDDLEEAPSISEELKALLDKLLGGKDAAKYYIRIFNADGSSAEKKFGPFSALWDYFVSGKGKVRKAAIFFPIDLMKQALGDKAEEIIKWFNANLKNLKDATGKANPRGSILLTHFDSGVRVDPASGDDNLTILAKKLDELKDLLEGDDLEDLGDDDDDEKKN